MQYSQKSTGIEPPVMLAIYLARCVNPLNFATRDLIYSCYASNSSNSCRPDERYRAAEFIAGELGRYIDGEK